MTHHSLLIALLLPMIALGAEPRDVEIVLSGAATHDRGVAADLAIILTESDGRWTGKLDLPLFNIQGLRFTEVRVNDGELEATTSGQRALSLVGVFEDDFRVFHGKLAQGPISLEVELSRDTEYRFKAINRPQNPRPPFPYRETEILGHHPDGHRLAGTLTRPEVEVFGEGPYVTAVLITGGGQEDRDSSALGHKPFLVLADALTRRGIAVMRYDDRGVGGSTVLADTPVGKDATSLDLSTDAVAVVRHLRDIDGIDPDRIGLIGHSEGGLIAPLAHRQDPRIGFMILLAGPCVSGAEVFRTQLKQSWLRETENADAVEAFAISFSHYQQHLADGATGKALAAEQKALAEEAIAAGLFADTPQADRFATAVRDFAEFDANWWRFMFGYDPTPALAGAHCPILALNGTLDVQVDATRNLAAIEQIGREAGVDVRAVRYEGLNHLFQPATTGTSDEYAKIEITIDDCVLADIAEWILRRDRRDRK